MACCTSPPAGKQWQGGASVASHGGKMDQTHVSTTAKRTPITWHGPKPVGLGAFSLTARTDGLLSGRATLATGVLFVLFTSLPLPPNASPEDDDVSGFSWGDITAFALSFVRRARGGLLGGILLGDAAFLQSLHPISISFWHICLRTKTKTKAIT